MRRPDKCRNDGYYPDEAVANQIIFSKSFRWQRRLQPQVRLYHSKTWICSSRKVDDLPRTKFLLRGKEVRQSWRCRSFLRVMRSCRVLNCYWDLYQMRQKKTHRQILLSANQLLISVNFLVMERLLSWLLEPLVLLFVTATGQLNDWCSNGSLIQLLYRSGSTFFQVGHEGIQALAISPLASHIVTWERYDKTLNQGNLIVWSIATGAIVQRFIQKTYSKQFWPPVQWTHDESLCARMTPNQVHIYNGVDLHAGVISKIHQPVRQIHSCLVDPK